MVMRGMVVAVAMLPGAAFGEAIQLRAAQPTDIARLTLFHPNPAAVNPKNAMAGFGLLQSSRATKLTVDEDDDNRDDDPQHEYDVDEGMQAIGAVGALDGGLAAGVLGQFGSREVKARFLPEDSPILEEFRTRAVSGRVSVEATKTLRLGLMMRYLSLETVNIAGNFNADDDRTIYKGSMTGFGAGLALNIDQVTFGVVYLPPMRGKAQVEGEGLILTEPGRVTLDADLALSKTLHVAGTVTRHFYIRDDRAEPSTSPEDQDEISLNGLDPEQFLMPNTSVGVGLAADISEQFALQAALHRAFSEFVFQSNKVPGDDDGSPNTVDGTIAQLRLGLRTDTVSLTAGMNVRLYAMGTLVDPESWFGDRNFRDFESDRRDLVATLDMAL